MTTTLPKYLKSGTNSDLRFPRFINAPNLNQWNKPNSPESKLYSSLLSKPPSALKRLIMKGLDKREHADIVYATFLNRLGGKTSANYQTLSHRESFLKLIEEWTHSELCIFIVREQIECEEAKTIVESGSRSISTIASLRQKLMPRNPFGLSTQPSPQSLSNYLRQKLRSANPVKISEAKQNLSNIYVLPPRKHSDVYELPERTIPQTIPEEKTELIQQPTPAKQLTIELPHEADSESIMTPVAVDLQETSTDHTNSDGLENSERRPDELGDSKHRPDELGDSKHRPDELGDIQQTMEAIVAHTVEQSNASQPVGFIESTTIATVGYDSNIEEHWVVPQPMVSNDTPIEDSTKSCHIM